MMHCGVCLCVMNFLVVGLEVLHAYDTPNCELFFFWYFTRSLMCVCWSACLYQDLFIYGFMGGLLAGAALRCKGPYLFGCYYLYFTLECRVLFFLIYSVDRKCTRLYSRSLVFCCHLRKFCKVS